MPFPYICVIQHHLLIQACNENSDGHVTELIIQIKYSTVQLLHYHILLSNQAMKVNI